MSRSTLISLFIWAALTALFLASLLGIGGAMQAVLAFIALSCLPGLALMGLAFRGKLDPLETAVFALALAPLITTCIAAALMFAGIGAAQIYPMAGVASSALYALSIARRHPERRGPAHGYGVLWLVAALAAIVIIPLAANGALRFRSDAWFHAAIVERIAQGGLPPTDPYYAGIPLRYFWAYHVYLLVLKSGAGCSAFSAMAAVNVLAFVNYLVAIWCLARRVTRWAPAPGWAMALAVFGINVFGWALFLGRAFLGENRGWAVLDALLHGGVYTVLQQMSIHYTGSLAFFLDKFFVGSPFALGLALFVLALERIVARLEGEGRWSLVLAALCALAAILFHTVIGISLVACAVAALAVTAALGWMRRRAGAPAKALSVGVALAACLILCFPYVRSIMAARSGAELAALSFKGSFAWTVFAAGILPLFLFAVRCVRGGLGRDGEIFLAAVMGAAFVLGSFAPLPLGNANKFVYLVFLPLIVLSSEGIGILSVSLRRAGVLGNLAAVFIVASAAVTAFLALDGYILDSGVEVPVAVRNGTLSPGEAEARAYAWIAANTPGESVFVNGGRNDIVVMGPRRQLWTNGTYAEAWGYEAADIEWRSRLVDDFYAGREAAPGQWARALALGGPVYCIVRPGDTRDATLEEIRAVVAGNSEEVFANEAFIIIAISP